jgi:hypothetical protein
VLFGPGSPVVGLGPGSTFVLFGAVLSGDDDPPQPVKRQPASTIAVTVRRTAVVCSSAVLPR